MHWTDRTWTLGWAFLAGLLSLSGRLPAATAPVASAAAALAPAASPVPANAPAPLLILGPGDEVRLSVFGQPNMDGTVYVGDDGSISVPLAGRVPVGGLSPSQAARKVQTALRDGQFLLHPHVTLTIVKSRSQQVAVLGQVHRPGIYPIESRTTVLELLAQAGGETADGANTVYILRPAPGGTVQRLAVNLQGLAEEGVAPQAALLTLNGGDQVYVPQAPVFYVVGQVHAPGRFRLDPGMTVLQAIARAGGITNMGSMGRVVIKRQLPGGRDRLLPARQTGKVRPNDVITVKERIF